MSTPANGSETAALLWLAAHEGELRPYAGQWVAVHSVHGLVAHGTLRDVDAAFKTRHPGDVALLYEVPPPDEPAYVV